MPVRPPDIVGIDQIGCFADLIDVRSPSEFADDHLPGARSHPVLDDAERAEIGTLHVQHSAFEARRRGAVLVARNIARHVETAFAGMSPAWHPLVYCWRGGKRSRAMALVLREIGWHASLLEGGYKTYRRAVIELLERRPAEFRFLVLCGETGSAKSALLAALARAGAQVLDLESLASHRGSVLGDLPHRPQPSQRSFESGLATALRGLDPARPVFVESESRKIGNLHVPPALIAAIRAAECIRISAPREARVGHLLREYRRLGADPTAVAARLEFLIPLHGAERVERWQRQVAAGDLAGFVADILEQHYDPAYHRSMARNFRRLAEAGDLTLESLEEPVLEQAATGLVLAYRSAITLMC